MIPPPSPSDARAHTADEHWFAKEVLPYEPKLRAYLHHRFPALSDLDDVVQESYLRLLRARSTGAISSIRGLLFTVARNAALDLFRRRRTAACEQLVETAPLNVLEDGLGLVETVCRDEELLELAKAIESLPQRCRQVLKLRKIYGLSHREIARQMGISERTVNVQVGLGVRRCAEYLQKTVGARRTPPRPS